MITLTADTFALDTIASPHDIIVMHIETFFYVDSQVLNLNKLPYFAQCKFLRPET